MNVLITDGETRSALAITRSLGAAGHNVYVSASKPHSLAGLSRYCAGEFAQPDGSCAPGDLAESIQATARQCNADRVMGTIDRTLTALHLASGADLGAALAPPGSEHYLNASDKAWLFERCRQWSIAVPDGEHVAGGALPDRRRLERLGSEWVLRTSVSWRWNGERWIHGRVRVASGWDALVNEIRSNEAFEYDYLVQQRIRGDGCGLFLCAHEGTIQTLFSHLRVREKPPWGGVSTLCSSVRPPEDLVAIAARFVEELGWSGLAMLEFKRDAADGTPYLLEVNARPWGSMALSRAAGVDFARAWLTPGQADGAAGTYREGVRLRWWWGDVDHYYLLEKENGGRKIPAMLLGFTRACVSGPRAEAWDTFRSDDPLPFAGETLAWLAGK